MCDFSHNSELCVLFCWYCRCSSSHNSQRGPSTLGTQSSSVLPAFCSELNSHITYHIHLWWYFWNSTLCKRLQSLLIAVYNSINCCNKSNQKLNSCSEWGTFVLKTTNKRWNFLIGKLQKKLLKLKSVSCKNTKHIFFVWKDFGYNLSMNI